MIMRIYSFENEFDFSENYVHVLQIEDTKLFSRVVDSISNAVQGKVSMEENIVFIEDDKLLKISKDIMMVIDPWNFDFNQKKIQTALFQHIENIFQIEYERMQRFNTSIKRLETEAMDVWNEYPFSFSYKENISVIDYLKMLGLKIDTEETLGVVAHILSIIDIIEFFHLAKLVVFVNIKLFLTEKELHEVYKYALYKKVTLLLVETGKESAPIDNEKILFVDSDFDEFFLYN